MSVLCELQNLKLFTIIKAIFLCERLILVLCQILRKALWGEGRGSGGGAHRLANPFLGDLRININSRAFGWKKSCEESKWDRENRRPQRRGGRQQRLLIPGSGVSSPAVSQMVMRKWSSWRTSPLRILSQTHKTEGKLVAMILQCELMAQEGKAMDSKLKALSQPNSCYYF